MVGGFVKGFVQGARGPEVTTAQVVGDVAGALVPGLGELKALQDVWDGTKSGDPARVVGGLIGLIPVIGAAGHAASKAATKVGGEVAQQGVKNAALHLSQAAAASARTAMKDPGTRKKLAVAAEHAGQLALGRLVNTLTEMQARGESPEVATRFHSKGFLEARNAAFEGLGEKPSPAWHDLAVEGEDGKKTVVGRHDMGTKGFRLLAPGPGPSDESNPLQLYWWKEQPDGRLAFGVEACSASEQEVSRIMDAYLNRERSFRVRTGTSAR